MCDSDQRIKARINIERIVEEPLERNQKAGAAYCRI
jgi:hypothetical protein